MNKYQRIASKIIASYESNLFTMVLKKQAHFCIRRYRLTGDKKYLQTIINFCELNKPTIINYIDNLSNRKSLLKEANIIFNQLPQKTLKNKLRKKEFLKHKEFLIYDYLLLHLNYWKSFKIYVDIYKLALKYMKNIDFTVYCSDYKFIKQYSTQLINSVYFLKNLKIYNGVNDFIISFKKLFMDITDENMTDLEFNNKIYGLTHIIIAESNYYQKFVSGKKFDWIIQYFNHNINQIISRTNVDIIAEVGVCYILCNLGGDNLKKTRQFIIKNHNNKVGYIPRGKNKNLSTSEHANIIASITLMGAKKLYQGPILTKYFN